MSSIVLILVVLSYLLIHVYYPALHLLYPILWNLLFQTLLLSTQHLYQCHPKKRTWRHRICSFFTPRFESILNYNYIFRALQHIILDRIIQNRHSHHYYFPPIPHILTYIIPNYYLSLTPSELPGYSTCIPPGDSPIEILSSDPVFNPVLIPIKDPAEDPSTVLPKQLYTAIYFICYSTPHTPYIPILYSTPIITLAHSPTHSPQKWLESIIVLSRQSLHILSCVLI